MSTLRTPFYEDLTPEQTFWLTLVQAACNSISSVDGGLTAGTVSHRFPGISAWERQTLIAVAHRCASRAGLTAEVEDEADRLTVRFARPRVAEAESPPSPAGQATGGAGSVWRHLFHGNQRRAAS